MKHYDGYIENILYTVPYFEVYFKEEFQKWAYREKLFKIPCFSGYTGHRYTKKLYVPQLAVLYTKNTQNIYQMGY